jgi:CDGSH-type Zn-finger protein
VPPGSALLVGNVAVFNIAGSFCATQDKCTHGQEDNTIVPMPAGPLYVRGRVQLRSADGSVIVEDTRLALCRCGKSHNKPFCDNSHRGVGFDDPGAVADGGVRAETNDGLSLTASANGPLLAQGAFVLRAAVGPGPV